MIRLVELTLAIARRFAQGANALAALIMPGTDVRTFGPERIAGDRMVLVRSLKVAGDFEA